MEQKKGIRYYLSGKVRREYRVKKLLGMIEAAESEKDPLQIKKLVFEAHNYHCKSHSIQDKCILIGLTKIRYRCRGL